jgi:hypothetical protein
MIPPHAASSSFFASKLYSPRAFLADMRVSSPQQLAKTNHSPGRVARKCRFYE